ncbi:fungal-specific transcription factor domain-containing protein [Desarmillaria tabescens]|uniref:Fungal-specific transcription factor domain-containing protein n=1 Tax=Armillaria tabescens TaxID=1929756 RepID=A0AA39KCA4_ARMTA|nr:fungal-specific transcription factor domain-containing protein [Desarmillaria tabescens]KAK0458526.1 fungal-specific transcription factor domain-containing protein [Desarmillaria tabescens]
MDGSERCSNCKLYDAECTYLEAAQKRTVSKGNVEPLDKRVQRLDSNAMSSFVLEGENSRRASSRFDEPPSTSVPPSHDTTSPLMPLKELAATGCSSNLPISDISSIKQEEPEDYLTLSDDFQRLEVRDDSMYRFFGKSSSVQLIQTVMDVKHGYASTEDSWLPPSLFDAMRPEFRTKRSWEWVNTEPSYVCTYTFPSDDLLADLIDMFLTKNDVIFPCLHGPTFRRCVKDKLHLRDEMFGAVVLLVCANASRQSDDPRVLLDGEDSKQSSGWKWFNQVQNTRRSLLVPPTIHDLQFYCLFGAFIFGMSSPQASWTVIGIGLRLAQDIGAHRKRNGPPTVESEMLKKVFWCLVAMDRDASCALGRPSGINDEDIDVGYLIECDDEYWENPDPEKAFKQPPGRPSKIAYFNTALRLNQLLGFCLRTIYCPNKSKVLLGFVGKEWEQHIVSELDSALNKWVDSVPEHLRWDPHREDELFFNQSVCLYTSYYHLQILVHRPFIPSPRNSSPLQYPSLAICTNAARSLCHLLDVQRRRGGSWAQHACILDAFAAGIVLLLNIWGGKKSGLALNPKKEMQDVFKCMQVMKDMESTYHLAGRLWDFMYQLANASDLPLPEQNSPPAQKRSRDHDTTGIASDTDSSRSRTNSSTEEMSPFAPESTDFVDFGAGGVPQQSPSQPHTNGAASNPVAGPSHTPYTSQDHLFGLPMHSADLGKMPLHGLVNFSDEIRDPTQQWAASASAYNAGTSYNMNVPSSVPQDFTFPANSPGDPLSSSATFNPEQLDDEAMAVWSNAPNGFELYDWMAYLDGVSHGG